MMPRLILALLFSVCFAAATLKENTAIYEVSGPQTTTSASVLGALMGDSRRLFASQLFAKADAYFHSGYYPTIFDRSGPKERSHMEDISEGQSHAESDHDSEHEEDYGFLGKPLDCIESFGRNFFPSQHSHLGSGNERELLPWLKLSAELDPQKVQTYTVASFWLRKQLGKVDEAEQFLREGLRENRDSYEILFELGRIAEENRNDPARARILYELALQKWEKQKHQGGNPDEFVYSEITLFLGRLEERAGNLSKAIDYLEKHKQFSPAKELLEKQILELRKKVNAGPAAKN